MALYKSVYYYYYYYQSPKVLRKVFLQNLYKSSIQFLKAGYDLNVLSFHVCFCVFIFSENKWWFHECHPLIACVVYHSYCECPLWARHDDSVAQAVAEIKSKVKIFLTTATRSYRKYCFKLTKDAWVHEKVTCNVRSSLALSCGL